MIVTLVMVAVLTGQSPAPKVESQSEAKTSAEREHLIAKRKYKAMTPQQKARFLARERTRSAAEAKTAKEEAIREETARRSAREAANFPRIVLHWPYDPGTEMLVWPGKGKSWIVAKDYFVAIDMLKLLGATDEIGLKKLIESRKAAIVSHGTRFLVIGTHPNMGLSGYTGVEGRILDGPLAGERVWISHNILAFQR